MRPTRFLLSLYLFICSIFLITNSGRLNVVDAASMFGVTKSLAVNHDFSNYECTPGYVQCVAGNFGKNYSAYGPVTSICHVGSYIVGATLANLLHKPERLLAPFAVVLAHSCFAALAPSLFCWWVWRLGFSLRVSCGFALLLAFATPYWFYATKGLFSEPYALIGLLASVACLLQAAKNGNRLQLWYLLLAGAGFGFAIGARVITTALYPALVLYFLSLVRASLFTKSHLRQAVAFHLPVIITIVLLGWFNYSRFGSVTKSGYHNMGTSIFAAFAPKAFANLLFHGAYGLIWFLAFALLLPFVVRAFFHKFPAETILCAAVVFLSLLIHSMLTFDAGWAYGPRYLVLTFPFLLLPFTALWSTPAKTAWYRPVFAGFIALSVFIQLQGVIVPVGRYFNLMRYNQRSGESPWWNGSLVLHNIDATPKVLGLVPGWKTTNPASLTEATGEETAFTKAVAVRNPQMLLETMPGGINLVLPDFWWLKLYYLGFPRALIGLLLLGLIAVIVWSGVRLARLSLADAAINTAPTPS